MDDKSDTKRVLSRFLRDGLSGWRRRGAWRSCFLLPVLIMMFALPLTAQEEAFPIDEDFEGTTLPEGWSVESVKGERQWELKTEDGNSYMDKALIRASEITYDKKNYTDAAYYFRQLLQTADSKEEKATARLGILRCSYYTDDYRSAVDIATEIMVTDTADNALMREARYCRAKSYWALGAKDSAATDLTALSTDVRHEMGAEATYMYAAYLTEKGDYDEAEKVIMKFIQENTPHQYWLAKCFVLLSDIYIAKGDDFMAKQYLISLQENYPDTTNDIRPLINERLDSIQSREEATILQ